MPHDENVVSIKTGMPKAGPLAITDSTIEVCGETYRVHRAIDPDSGNGFVTVHDYDGRPVMVRPAHVADEVLPDLVLAWLTGRGVGRREGRNRLRQDLSLLLKPEF